MLVYRALREHLEGEGYTVIAIAPSDLADTQLMLLHMKRIAFALRMRERAPALAGDRTKLRDRYHGSAACDSRQGAP